MGMGMGMGIGIGIGIGIGTLFHEGKRINHKSYLTYGPRTILIFTGIRSILKITTRSYYRKESATSSPMDQSQHAQFAE